MAAIDLLIFDLDGTLVDSKDDISSCVNATLKKFGVAPVPTELIVAHVGVGIRPLLADIVRQNNSLELTSLLSEFERCYELHLSDETLPFPNIRQVLTHYSSKQKIVLTNKMQHFADKVMDDLDLRRHFTAVYGREAFSRHKPDPLPVLEICRQHKVDLRKAVIIGDTDLDIVAGKKAGIFTCAALYGYGKVETIVEAEPDFKVKRAADLIGLFQ